MKRAIGLALAAAVAMLGTGLDTAKSEPNPEKRSRLALENANAAIDAAGKAYAAGSLNASTAALAEVRDSVDLSQEALKATGKDPRRSPKAFKHAEVEIREMLRRLSSLETDFSVDDRGEVIKTEDYLRAIHDELIQQILGKKK